MTSDNSLQRAVDDFNRTLDAIRFQGVSQIAELVQLKILITKYPEQTRQILNDHRPRSGPK